MSGKWVAVALLAAGVAAAQQNQAEMQKASVSGVVRDATSGDPIAGYQVSTFTNSTWIGDTILEGQGWQRVAATTDSAGRYTLTGLAPGSYRIMANDARNPSVGETRPVVLAGSNVDGIDFRVTMSGSISGRVVDENGDPVAKASLRLIAREYFLGAVGYYTAGFGTTDADGKYTMSRVPPGRSFLIQVEKRDPDLNLEALSETPANPKLRRKIPARMWYPNSPAIEGGQPLILRSGEHREGMNIEMKMGPSLCIEGVTAGVNGPSKANLSIQPQGASGISATMGMFFAAPNTTTGEDGKFRICDLTPGTYRLTAEIRGAAGGPSSGHLAQLVVLSDEDVKNVKLTSSPLETLTGQVVLDGPQPDSPLHAQVEVWLTPMYRAPWIWEKPGGKFDIPSEFKMENVLLDDYSVRSLVSTPGLYVKAVTYAGRDVTYEPLNLATAMKGTALRVEIGRDGAQLSAKVTDKDGNPVTDARILVIPADAVSEGVMAARLVNGRTDQTGNYTSQTLEPGKYLVAACGETVDASAESIDKVWHARNRFQDVTVSPNGQTQVSLNVIKLD